MDQRRGGALRPVPWEELIAHGMYAGRNADALHDLAVAGTGDGASRPYLDAAFEAIARGRQGELEAKLLEQGWPPPPRCCRGAGAGAGGGAIHSARPSGRCRGRGPRGCCSTTEEVALSEYAAQVAADSAAVGGLRQWLGDHGMRHDYVPIEEPSPAALH